MTATAMTRLDETHDPRLASWVASAQAPGQDFPIQNLPFAAFRRAGSGEAFRGGAAIGDAIVDLAAACAAGVFSGDALAAAERAAAPSLNGLMAMGRPAARALRLALSRLLRTGALEADRLSPCLVDQRAAEYRLPSDAGDYTDFLSSLHHMSNMAAIFTPGAPVSPNFLWQPLAYHGRASSLAVSGTAFSRPHGPHRNAAGDGAVFGPTERLDYEVELGFFVGDGVATGRTVALADAEDRIFGLCLLNDWSARDVQGWESNPLGPFLGKNFCTSVAPWVVTLDALEPYRCAVPRPAGADSGGLAYLQAPGHGERGGIDIQLEAWLRTAASTGSGTRLSRTSFGLAHWSVGQMLAHHAVGGCGLRSGDLIGTGTQSGPGAGEEGCLMEMSGGGRRAVPLDDGGTRSFLHDGDTVVLRGWCERAGHPRIGFGECAGTVLPAAAA